jgi:hypothetical protein
MKYVSVYEIGRRYGGSEEGGWWYDTGTLVLSQRVWTDEQADELVAKLQDEYPRTGNRCSVLGGEDYDVVVEDHDEVRIFWPEKTPRYE